MNSSQLASSISYVGIAIIPFMLGMICHEVAHGWAAYKMGDPTAKRLGRLTMNPMKHLDPLGTLCFVITAVGSSVSGFPFVLGWAKPVPFNPNNFRDIRKGLFCTAIAGPATNLLLALAFALFLAIYNACQPHNVWVVSRFTEFTPIIPKILVIGVWINCTLAWFNLMPVPPLDGSKVIGSLLPAQLARAYFSLERIGLLIMIVLLMTGVLQKVMWPLIQSTILLLNKVSF